MAKYVTLQYSYIHCKVCWGFTRNFTQKASLQLPWREPHKNLQMAMHWDDPTKIWLNLNTGVYSWSWGLMTIKYYYLAKAFHTLGRIESLNIDKFSFFFKTNYLEAWARFTRANDVSIHLYKSCMRGINSSKCVCVVGKRWYRYVIPWYVAQRMH